MSAPDCAAAIIGQLLAQGVTEAVLAPGSRSAPLAMALAAAERAGRLRLHVRFDERSAGFLALGLAKAAGVPVPVLTTSGTAVANLLPAALEAHHSEVPLIVLSADRPAALVGFGANQTTDQVGLFNPFVRWSARISATAPAASWSAQVARGWLLALGGGGTPAGPVQLNVEFTEPLVGGAAEPVLRPVGRQVTTPPVPVELPAGPRTLLICGDASPQVGAAVAEAARAAGLPLIAEPSSNARLAGLRTGRLLVSGGLGEQVQRVVLFGHPTLSRPVNRLLARDDVEVVVVNPGPSWPDPGWRASLIAGAVTLPVDDGEWLAQWTTADQRVAAGVDDLLGAQEVLTGPAVALAVAASVGDGVLVLGNSQPIRDADLAMLGGATVFANRGLAGIDGTVSTAVGIALATGRPTTLLCGDLTFLHDGNGLARGVGEPRPNLRIVVADDDGGSIFATLEYGDQQYAEDFERVFATPSGIEVALLAEAHGAQVHVVATAEDLGAALSRPINGLEVLLATIDRAGRRALNEAIHALV